MRMPASARAAAATSAAHAGRFPAAVGRVGEDYRQHARRAFAVALFALNQLVGFCHRAEGGEFGVAIGAEVFVEGHSITTRLSLLRDFKDYTHWRHLNRGGRHEKAKQISSEKGASQ